MEMEVLLPAFSQTHIDKHTRSNFLSLDLERLYFTVTSRQLTNLPHFTPTQPPSCFCQQCVGEHGTRECLQSGNPEKNTHIHTHTAQTQPYHCLCTLPVEAHICTEQLCKLQYMSLYVSITAGVVRLCRPDVRRKAIRAICKVVMCTGNTVCSNVEERSDNFYSSFCATKATWVWRTTYSLQLISSQLLIWSFGGTSRTEPKKRQKKLQAENLSSFFISYERKGISALLLVLKLKIKLYIAVFGRLKCQLRPKCSCMGMLNKIFPHSIYIFFHQRTLCTTFYPSSIRTHIESRCVCWGYSSPWRGRPCQVPWNNLWNTPSPALTSWITHRRQPLHDRFTLDCSCMHQNLEYTLIYTSPTIHVRVTSPLTKCQQINWMNTSCKTVWRWQQCVSLRRS